eukprot:gene12710-biopygen6465
MLPPQPAKAKAGRARGARIEFKAERVPTGRRHCCVSLHVARCTQRGGRATEICRNCAGNMRRRCHRQSGDLTCGGGSHRTGVNKLYSPRSHCCSRKRQYQPGPEVSCGLAGHHQRSQRELPPKKKPPCGSGVHARGEGAGEKGPGARGGVDRLPQQPRTWQMPPPTSRAFPKYSRRPVVLRKVALAVNVHA